MALIDPTKKEIHCKLVYYGPTFSGKTSTLQYIHQSIAPHMRSDVFVIPTETERTIFFDCCHPKHMTIYNYALRLHLYTISGSVLYGQSKHNVLIGADGVVFVATSEPNRFRENKHEYNQLVTHLARQRTALDSLPIVLQFNKRDVPQAVPAHKLNQTINHENRMYFETVAIKGIGILETFDAICNLAIRNINNKHKPGSISGN